MGKIAVLGLGPSIHEFNPTEFELSIGVNDIWRYVKSNVIVCLDHTGNFTAERLKVINESRPETFYSQIVSWDTRPDFKKINILPNYPNTFLDLNLGIYKSFCSPFVGVQIAYKYYYADEIHLFGCDMVNHRNLNGELCNKIKGHFKVLKSALEAKNVKLVVHGSGILVNI